MRASLRWMLGGFVAGLAGFALLALDDVAHGPLSTALDPAVDEAVGQAGGGPAHGLGEALTLIGDWRTEAFAVTAATAWLLVRREWILASWCIAMALVAGVAVQGLKALFARARPEPGILESFSFPSGHTMGATAGLGIAIILATEGYIRSKGPTREVARRSWSIALAAWAGLAFLAGLGRILVREHWLTDVAASWMLGLALVSGALYVLSRKARGGDPGPTAPPGK